VRGNPDKTGDEDWLSSHRILLEEWKSQCLNFDLTLEVFRKFSGR
jgi:hypothetical protein